MAAVAGLVSVEEYLRTSYKPACEYIDGVLRQKPMPTRKHGIIQRHLGTLASANGDYEAATELTVRVREGKYLVPDIGVQARNAIQDPYPTEPIFLCVEILSPQDRFAEILMKCDEYLTWGVPTTWIVDPDSRRAWVYTGHAPNEVPASGALTAGALSVPLADLFSVLD